MITRNGHVKGIKVLVINPNSSVVLTGGLEYMIGDLGYSEVCTAFIMSEWTDSMAFPRRQGLHTWMAIVHIIFCEQQMHQLVNICSVSSKSFSDLCTPFQSFP